jgi:hypothetical protein
LKGAEYWPAAQLRNKGFKASRLSPGTAFLTAAGAQAAGFLGSIIAPAFGFLGSKINSSLLVTQEFALKTRIALSAGLFAN